MHNDELQAVLQRERSWLDQAQRTMEEARRWRELEMRRFWPGVIRRWLLALVFALAPPRPLAPATEPSLGRGRLQ